MSGALSGLTTRGRALIAAGLTAITLAVLFGQRDILRVGVLITALPLLAALGTSRARFRLASHRDVVPSRIAAGAAAEVRLRLENVASLPTGLLLIEDLTPGGFGVRPRFLVDRLPPRSTRTVQYRVEPPVRGRYAIGPVSIRVTDPFGLCTVDRAFTSRDLLVVTPPVEQLPPIHIGGDWSGNGDSRARSVASAGEDDVAVREYRHGDELRRVHWRATAHRGELMVRREEQPWESRATVLLDTRAVAHRSEAGDDSFEQAVAAAASAGVHLVRRGYTVRLATSDGPEIVSAGHEPATVSSDTEGLLLDALAVVTTAPGHTLGGLTPTIRHHADGLLVAVLGHLGPADADELVRARHGMGTTIAIVVDVPARLSVDHEERSRLDVERQGALALMRAGGWRVVTLDRHQPLADRWPLAARAGLDAVRPEEPALGRPA